MLYLLDANVLIDANRDYYPIERIPEFWEWLIHMGNEGQIKIPEEVYEEIKSGDKKVDPLKQWAIMPETKAALLLEEEVDPRLVAQVVNEGYAIDLTDVEVEKIGRDAFMVAYGLIDPPNRVIVTTEVSKPSAQRANRHLPDVCHQFGLRCCNTYTLIRELDFNTRKHR